MPRTDSMLFRVVLEDSRTELAPSYILAIATRTERCVRELLACVGYHGHLKIETGQTERRWHMSVHVERSLMTQMDLFTSRGQLPTVTQASKDLIEAAVVSIARFRKEVAGIKAATLQETLKQLKSANPRVIAALARQPGRKMTVLQDGAAIELKPQSDAGRSVSTQSEKLLGVIVASGFEEIFLIPSNRRNRGHLCIHPVRIKITEGLRKSIDPHQVLEEFVRPGQKVALTVQREQVVRKRQHVTYLLAQWPPKRVG